MRTPITIPDFRLGDEPLRLGEWAVEVGDEIDAGETVAELICPGLSLELVAPVAGVVAELCQAPGHPTHTGEIVGWIKTG